MPACTSCGIELPEGARFCPACGAPVEAPAPAGEMLRLVTVLFADVVGSTARAETMHPEDARALMADFFGAMSEEIQAQGGTLEKFVGDAIMAVFGVPAAHEDDPVRAIRAARRMLTRLERWNEGRPEGERLAIRIGINTGDVVAAGAPGQDLLVTGDPVNVAARLQQAADGGQILVGERTARSATAWFELQPVEPLELKGKSEAVAAWLVESEREGAEPRGIEGMPTPMVGRGRELDLLRATFARVHEERSPSLVTVLGDAGVGKSRLLREFVGSLEVETKVVVGRCLAYGEGVTLWPLGEILKSEAVVFEDEPAETATAKIRTLVDEAIPDELVPDRERATAALAATIGLRLHSDPLAALDPRQVQHELVSAWRALLAGIAQRQPLLVVVEDLHWADESMLELLEDFSEHVAGPVLFLCTARPDLVRSRPSWGGGSRNFSSLALDPLTPEQSTELVSQLLDVDELPAAVRERILERSEGNPFYLEEIVRRLIDEELIVHEGGRWVAGEAVAELEIPDTVQGVILARIDLLSPAERRALQLAAVVGRVFWPGPVAVLGVEDDLDPILRTLSRRELIVSRLSSSLGGEPEYAFKHVLIRDVAYESLPRRERAAAHAAVAPWIEEMAGERAEGLAELLAHHYDAAWGLGGDEELRGRARQRYLEASQGAIRRFATTQADRFGRRAVELSATRDERLAALEALGDVFASTFDGDRTYRAYREALAEVEDGDDATFARLAAKAAIHPTRFVGSMTERPATEELRALIDRGLAAATSAGAYRDRALLLMSTTFLGVMRYEPLGPETTESARAALEITERLDDPALMSAALDAVGALQLAAGHHGPMLEGSRRRLQLVPYLSDPVEVGDIYAVAAWNATYVGLYDQAIEWATECIERSRELAALGVLLHGLVWRVLARFVRGDWAGALADQEEIERLQSDPDRLPAGYSRRAYVTAAFCHELRGEREAADRYVALLRRCLADNDPGQTHRTGAFAPLARLLARRGLFAESRELCPTEVYEGRGPSCEAFCEVVAAEETWDEADATVAEARAIAEECGILSLPFFADRLEGRAAAAGGDDERASELLRRSAEGFAGLSAPWEEAWSRLLLAELTREPEEARAALATFEPLGSVAELERARSLLATLPSR
jgi:class 3 adenylate cyclase